MVKDFEHTIDRVLFDNIYQDVARSIPGDDYYDFAKEFFLQGMEYQRAINETKKVA